MTCTMTAHAGETQAMPRVFKINLPPGSRKESVRIVPTGFMPGSGIRFPWQTRRDDAAFDAAWFRDFRERWRRALRDARFSGPLAQFEQQSEPQFEPATV